MTGIGRNKMELDLSFNGKIERKYVTLFNRIAKNTIVGYNELIESISNKNRKNIDWWMSSISSRNTFSSTLFHYLSCLVFVKYLLEHGEKISRIGTDSRAFQRIVQRYLNFEGMKIKVTLNLSLREKAKVFIKPFYYAFFIPLKFLLQYILTPNKRIHIKKPPSFPLILIDTFILPEFIDCDRYYPSLLEFIDKDELEKVFFVPFLYGFNISGYYVAIKELRKKSNLIFKEDFLKLKDYLYAWCYIFRINKIKIGKYHFDCFDVTSLIREELLVLRGYYATFAGLLNFCFAKRLKKAGIKVKLIINWFENQSTDKGFNAGFRRYYPNVKCKGYQGWITSPYFLCIYPTKEEKKAKVIPHQVAVIGSGFIEPVRKFCPDLDVRVAPAFRFQGVWKKRRCYPDKDIFRVLIGLPIMLDESRHILSLTALAANMSNDSVHYWIKPHPAVSPVSFKKILGTQWPEKFEIITGDFNEWVEKSNLLISSASSICLETIAKGIPVIVVGNQFGLTHNPIPESVDTDIYRICFNAEEIGETIEYYKDKSNREFVLAGRKTRKAYFEPLTQEGIDSFLELV